MHIICIGLSHQTASSDIRERYAIPDDRMRDALNAVVGLPSVTEAAILKTCGRFEIYACVMAHDRALAGIKTLLADVLADQGCDFDAELHTYAGEAAVKHLFRTSAGLETIFLGETDILAQIKRAYVQAQEARSVGPVLHRLFCEALRSGKAARSETAIATKSLSIGSVAVATAKARLGTLREKSVLVIGTGRMGSGVMRRLRDEGAGTVMVCNRTRARARELVSQIRFGETIEWQSLGEAIKSADVVIASTGAPQFVLGFEEVLDAMKHRPAQPLLVVDVAVPRNVDPAIAGIPNVSVIGIDQLSAAVDATLQTRLEAIPHVEQIVTDSVARFEQWRDARAAVPLITMLMRKAEAIRDTEFNGLLERCSGLTERERALIVAVGSTLVSKVMHSTISVLQEKSAPATCTSIRGLRRTPEMVRAFANLAFLRDPL